MSSKNSPLLLLTWVEYPPKIYSCTCLSPFFVVLQTWKNLESFREKNILGQCSSWRRMHKSLRCENVKKSSKEKCILMNRLGSYLKTFLLPHLHEVGEEQHMVECLVFHLHRLIIDLQVCFHVLCAPRRGIMKKFCFCLFSPVVRLFSHSYLVFSIRQFYIIKWNFFNAQVRWERKHFCFVLIFFSVEVMGRKENFLPCFLPDARVRDYRIFQAPIHPHEVEGSRETSANVNLISSLWTKSWSEFLVRVSQGEV